MLSALERYQLTVARNDKTKRVKDWLDGPCTEEMNKAVAKGQFMCRFDFTPELCEMIKDIFTQLAHLGYRVEWSQQGASFDVYWTKPVDLQKGYKYDIRY